MFQNGQKVFLSAPGLVEDRKVLCIEATIPSRSEDSDPAVYWIPGVGPCMEKYIFADREAAEAAGRSYILNIVHNIKRRAEQEAAIYEALLKE